MIEKAQKDIGFPEREIPLFEEHLKYGTCDCYHTEGRFQAIVRYNISKSGRIAYIIDLYCSDDRFSIKAMRWFGAEGKRKFPSLQFIKFGRWKKNPYKKPVIYKLDRLFR